MGNSIPEKFDIESFSEVCQSLIDSCKHVTSGNVSHGLCNVKCSLQALNLFSEDLVGLINEDQQAQIKYLLRDSIWLSEMAGLYDTGVMINRMTVNLRNICESLKTQA